MRFRLRKEESVDIRPDIDVYQELSVMISGLSLHFILLVMKRVNSSQSSVSTLLLLFLLFPHPLFFSNKTSFSPSVLSFFLSSAAFSLHLLSVLFIELLSCLNPPPTHILSLPPYSLFPPIHSLPLLPFISSSQPSFSSFLTSWRPTFRLLTFISYFLPPDFLPFLVLYFLLHLLVSFTLLCLPSLPKSFSPMFTSFDHHLAPSFLLFLSLFN